MSKDSSHTYVHFRSSHHADLFEEFCQPLSTSTQSGSANHVSGSGSAPAPGADPSDPSLQNVPGYFMPFESINLPPHLMPVNPEDEDGVVPEMHAAFGIAQAIGQSSRPDGTGERNGRGILQSQRGDGSWTDFGLEELVTNVGSATLNQHNAGASANDPSTTTTGRSIRREGRRTALLNMR